MRAQEMGEMPEEDDVNVASSYSKAQMSDKELIGAMDRALGSSNTIENVFSSLIVDRNVTQVSKS